MKSTTKKNVIAVAGIAALIAGIALVPGCSAADTASRNVSTEADSFRVTRRFVAINLITDKYLFEAKGKCSLGNNDPVGEISLTCKVGENPDRFRKHYIKYSTGANITVIIEQLEDSNVSDFSYELLFRPETIVPTITR